jgi:hypothetical protein
MPLPTVVPTGAPTTGSPRSHHRQLAILTPTSQKMRIQIRQLRKLARQTAFARKPDLQASACAAPGELHHRA